MSLLWQLTLVALLALLPTHPRSLPEVREDLCQLVDDNVIGGQGGLGLTASV